MKRVLFSLLVATTILLAESKNFSVDFNNTDFKINNLENVNRFQKIEIIPQKNETNYSWISSPKDPEIPVRVVNLSVPLDAEFSNVEVEYETKLISSNIMVQPTRYPYPLSKPELIRAVEPNRAVYSSQNSFPANVATYLSTSKMSGYRYFSFAVSPFIYKPLSGELYLVTKVDVKVDYNRTRQSYRDNDDGTFANIVKSKVINPFDVTERRALVQSSVKFLIVTSNALKSAFKPLADWKTQSGIPTEIVTVEDIYSKTTGSTYQLRIKNFIHNYYLNKGTMFVLLGGDDKVVPDQNTYCDVPTGDATQKDATIPADIFYGCFDAPFDWDLNKNGIAGEFEDKVDLAPEIFVTRASVRTVQNADAFVTKTLNYQKSPSVTNFANRMLNSGVMLWNPGDAKTKSDIVMESINSVWNPAGKEVKHLFDNYTNFSQASNYDVTPQNLVEQMNSGYNIMHMLTHGNQAIWGMEYNGLFHTANAYSLSNLNKQGVIVTIACITNAFDTDGSDNVQNQYYNNELCLSEAFLTNPNGGAVAYFGSSRFGWGTPFLGLMGSELLDSHLLKNLMAGGQGGEHRYWGQITAEAKSTMAAGALLNYGNVDRWLSYAVNPMGDPTLDIYTDNPKAIDFSLPSTTKRGAALELSISTGIANALVCLSKENDLYITGKADAQGIFKTSVRPTSVGVITVTVTAHNIIPKVKTVTVLDGTLYNAPSSILAKTDLNGISLSWPVAKADPAEDAISYNIYKNDILLANSKENRFRDDNVTNLFTNYCVSAVYANGVSEKSPNIKVLFTNLPADSKSPSEVSLSHNLGVVTVNWAAPVVNQISKVLATHNNRPGSVGLNLITTTYKSPAYGVVFSIKDYNVKSLNSVDFYHNDGEAKNSLYNLLIVNMDERKIIKKLSSLTANLGVSKGWEKNISLNGITVPTGCSNIGVFIQPLNGIYPALWSDNRTTTISSALAIDGDNVGYVPEYGDLSFTLNPMINLNITTNERSINASRALVSGYSIYRDGLYLGSTNATITKFTDTALPNGEYTYQVTALYPDPLESNPRSAKINIISSDINTKEELMSDLIGNYPNPFNPVTTISFVLRDKSDIKIEIFNVSGAMVKSISSSNLYPGSHSVVVDGSGLNSGVYYYRLITNHGNFTSRMLLLK